MTKHYILIKGSGDYGLADKADAIVLLKKTDNRWKETIVSDQDGILNCLKGSASYMGYLSVEDVISYIKEDSKGRFFSVKKISKAVADKVFADPYNWED